MLVVLEPVLPNRPVLGGLSVPVLGADRLVLLALLPRPLLLLPVGGRLEGPPGRTPVSGEAGGLMLVSGLGDVGDEIELPELRRPDEEPSSGLD